MIIAPLTEVRLIIERLDPIIMRWWPMPGAVFTTGELDKAKVAAARMDGVIRLLRVIGNHAKVLGVWHAGQRN